MKNKTYRYIGAFISREQLQELTKTLPRKVLECPVDYPHVTFAYQPDVVDEQYFGAEIHIRAIGYGCDGKNEGLKVCLDAEQSELQILINQIPVPHITLSISETGRAVNTRYLQFTEIKPIDFTATFGGYIDQKGPILTPPAK